LIGVVLVLLAAVSYALVGGRGGKVQNAARTSLAKAAPVTNLTLAPLLTAGTGSVISAAAASAARIQFGASSYDFGTVTSGEVVKRTYFFTNAGSAMLEVSNVQASCGCTTAGEWTRQVEPGKTGTIPIQFNSSNFGGQVAKTITVTCNDPTQPSVLLQITGNVWRPIEVTPQFAVVTVSAESPSNATTVRIVNKEEAPLTLTAPEVNNAAFAVELRTNQPGKQFELMIRTVPPLPDEKNRQGRVTLKTSSTNMALINVTAVANVQPVVSTGPAQIILPPAPLANATGSSVSIVNNGTNRLALSEAAVNGKSVDVQLREIEAGRTFVVALNFPAGFEIAPGERVELSVKSNHPQYPTIKVPVIQPPRPTTP
jgi:hypothetical protein